MPPQKKRTIYHADPRWQRYQPQPDAGPSALAELLKARPMEPRPPIMSEQGTDPDYARPPFGAGPQRTTDIELPNADFLTELMGLNDRLSAANQGITAPENPPEPDLGTTVPRLGMRPQQAAAPAQIQPTGGEITVPYAGVRRGTEPVGSMPEPESPLGQLFGIGGLPDSELFRLANRRPQVIEGDRQDTVLPTTAPGANEYWASRLNERQGAYDQADQSQALERGRVEGRYNALDTAQTFQRPELQAQRDMASQEALDQYGAKADIDLAQYKAKAPYEIARAQAFRGTRNPLRIPATDATGRPVTKLIDPITLEELGQFAQPPTAQQRNQKIAYDRVAGMIDELEKLGSGEEIRGPEGNITRPASDPISKYTGPMQIPYGAGRGLMSMLNLDPTAKAYDAMRKFSLPSVSRAAGEVGVLTDQDIERIQNALPSRYDDRHSRSLKFSEIRGILRAAAERSGLPIGSWGNEDPRLTSGSPAPSSQGGLQVGQPVTLKDGTSGIVTAVYPDGTFDYE